MAAGSGNNPRHTPMFDAFFKVKVFDLLDTFRGGNERCIYHVKGAIPVLANRISARNSDAHDWREVPIVYVRRARWANNLL
jgi:hypothetical protein